MIRRIAFVACFGLALCSVSAFAAQSHSQLPMSELLAGRVIYGCRESQPLRGCCPRREAEPAVEPALTPAPAYVPPARRRFPAVPFSMACLAGLCVGNVAGLVHRRLTA